MPLTFLKNFSKIAALLLITLSLSSCLYMSSKKESVFDKNLLTPVKFESSEASSIFFETIKINNIEAYKGPFMKEESTMIPFIYFKSNKIFYETEYTNYKIKEADTNSDGVISLKEAKNLRNKNYSVVIVTKVN